jgi:uncharacterized membrane protein (DUF2068 family)
VIDWGLVSCGLRGHITYRPDESEYADRLRAATVAGDAWRCLRCGTYVAEAPAGSGPAELAPTPTRGRALRQLIILRLLAVLRAVEGTAWLAVGITAWFVSDRVPEFLAALKQAVPALEPVTRTIGWDIDRSWLARMVDRWAEVSPDTIILLGTVLAALGAVKWAEAVGLWMGKRWGEYLAAVATAAFIPVEVFELVEHISAFKIVLLLINVAAVVWLVVAKRLFGVRGGLAAEHAENEEVSLLTVERAAEVVKP